MKKKSIYIFGLNLICLFLLNSVLPAAELDEKTKKIVLLRAEIQKICDEIDFEKQNIKSELSMMDLQIQELTLLVQRETIRLKTLKSEINNIKNSYKSYELTLKDYKEAFLKNHKLIFIRVKSGIPFKIEQRLKHLTVIKNDVKNGEITIETGFSRLWNFIEDELSLCNDISIHQQVIEFKNNKEIVNLLKIGMVTLFVKSNNGEFGYLDKHEENYIFKLADNEKDFKNIQLLYKSVEKGVKQGIFELPVKPGWGG